MATVIVKQIRPPATPEGDPSHRRKLRSYEIEARFYRDHAGDLGALPRVAKLLGERWDSRGGELVLEDLDSAGFPERRRRASLPEIHRCLSWLARFHARFLGRSPEGLWPVGSYWHLATRQAELAKTQEQALRRAAPELDRRLSQARFQTLVHGDAKLANFCFPSGDGEVVAVDFQYVGAGVGSKDVIYLLGCLDAHTLERHSETCLEHYFAELVRALEDRLEKPQTKALVEEWRSLLPLAWADFERFLSGWAPGYPRAPYIQARVAEALEALRS